MFMFFCKLATKIYTRTEWGGANACGTLYKMETPLDRVIVHQTGNDMCSIVRNSKLS